VNRRNGFTLLELILAMLIVSVVAGAVYGTLVSAFRSRDNIMGAIEPQQRAEVAVEFLHRDLESALPPTGYLANAFQGTTDPATGGDGTDTGHVSFNAAVDGPHGAMQTDIRQIDYLVAKDGNDNALVRRVTSNTLVDDLSNALYDDEVLCRGVRSFVLEYYYDDGTTAQWEDAWDSTVASSNLGTTETNLLPSAVRVTLTLDPTVKDGPAITVSRVFQLPCVAPATQPGGTQ